MHSGHYSITVTIEEANKVKAECFRAAVTLSTHAKLEAEAMQQRFMKRFGGDFTEYATLTYEQWEKGCARGAA